MAAQASDGPRVRVAALATIEGRVVTVRHRAGSSVYHLLPGGGVDYGETLSAALEREFLEETGLEVTVGEPLFINDTIDPSGIRHVVNITFQASVTGGQITSHPADRRVEAVDLVDPEQLPELDLRPPLATYILAALDGSGERKMLYLGPLFTQGRRVS